MTADNIGNLQEFYSKMGIEEKSIGAAQGFTIHRVQHSIKVLPFRSQSFRPDYYNFLFSKDGDGSYTIDEKYFPVNNRTIYFTNPGNFRTFEWARLSDACLITFDEAFLKEYVYADIFQQFPYLLTETVRPRTLSTDQYARVERLYTLIETEFMSQSPFRNRIIGSLLVALLHVVKEYCYLDYNPIYEGNRSSQIVKSFKIDLDGYFRDILDTGSEQQIRVQYFADKQNLHVNYLSQVISNKTGRSMLQWINEKAISTAKVLLQDNAFSIKEISYRMGFVESAHFSNYFKKHSGESPASYRKNHFS
ncbi:helix-turn-helix domain-containing protein [Pedobacter endophyticus]|uniref:Helix-turn-helix transcriptional regulator n=1 Tax=Pedobacter endophyticus TaxID=2789740 RepID=A0A7U3Q4Z4_9SPHI|nr:AraC family transcriptional regulator [Pedobacter endophyticus]QPH38698.1 helix-turn-helix transcriptional regulator [Pedobacter endophyticus]